MLWNQIYTIVFCQLNFVRFYKLYLFLTFAWLKSSNQIKMWHFDMWYISYFDPFLWSKHYFDSSIILIHYFDKQYFVEGVEQFYLNSEIKDSLMTKSNSLVRWSLDSCNFKWFLKFYNLIYSSLIFIHSQLFFR